MYNVDSTGKQYPTSKVVKDAYGRATTPAPYPARHPRPTHILINKVGNYSFAYESGSLASYESGSVITADGPVRLDINPVAWETVPAGGTKGAVTFVYTGDIG